MRSVKKRNRLMSLLLMLVMAMSLAVPAAAADYNDAFVSIELDGGEVYSTSRSPSGTQDILTAGSRELASLDVNGNSISLTSVSATAASAETRYANGYDGTSGTYRIYTEILNGVRVIRLSWNNLRTALMVSATSESHGSYKITASAQPGSACDVSNPSADVEADGSYTCDFVPATRQEIRSINFNVNGVNRSVTVPMSGTTSVTVANQDIDITVMTDRTVRVRIPYVIADTSMTAQVYNLSTRYVLNVNTDGSIKSSVDSDVLESGSYKTVTLTPDKNVNIGEIVISSNGYTGTIGLTDKYVSVNGVKYSIERNRDGSAVLTIPAMNADVDIQVLSDKDTARVEIICGSGLRCDKAGVNFVSRKQPFMVTFEVRKSSVVLSTIKCTTARGTWKASTDDNYLIIDGEYFPIYRNRDGDVSINFSQVPGNMTLEIVSRDTEHDVKVTTDSRIEADVSRTTVYDGDGLDVTFKLLKDSYDIRLIRVTVDGKSYQTDPYNNKYITVDGERWYFSFNDNGTVVLEIPEIEADLSIYASTTRSGSSNGTSSGSAKTYSVSKSPDSHSNIRFTGSTPFDAGDDTDVRVYTDSKYVIKSIRLNINGRSATITPFDKTVKVDGETYDITWKSNADCTIKITGIYANISVGCTSVKGDEKTPDSSNNNNTNTPDDSWTVITKPTAPSTGDGSTNTNTYPNTNLGVNGYHKAYMYGFGDNTFRPDQSMTRAQTIAILCRLYSGINDADFKAYAGNPGFQDVNPNSTFAGYIGYAKQQGYLSAIVGSGLNLNPQKAITRAEFCTLLCAFTNQNLVGVSTAQKFQDVPSNHWAVVYVNYCAERGWANGYANGLFQPDSSLTRAQMCVIVNRINNRSVGTTSIGYNLRNFNDVAQGHWAYADIMEATHNHTVKSVVNGVETWAV